MSSFPRLALSLLIAVPAALPAAPVTPENRAKIEAALPATAPAQPAKPRKLLIYSQTKGYRHSSIETGTEAITQLGARTGAFTATASEDPAVLTADSLRGFDAVLFLNVTGNIFDRVESQQALLEFVRNGGGVAGIHSATDACYEWPQWGEMLGGWFDGHPWSWRSHVTVWIEEPGHPLNAAFDGASSLAIQDEIYQLKGPDFRQTHRVISSLDPRRTDMSLPTIKRADRDFPITQIREYGKGRVLYCALGHNEHIFWNRAVLGHYLAGLQWVMGDLKADATPRPRAAMPPLASDPAFWSVTRATAATDDPRILDRLDVAVAEAGKDPARLSELEQKLAGFFAEEQVTPAARQAAARRLALVLTVNPGTKANATLALLARALREEAKVIDARLALDPVPGEAVDNLYLEALKESSGPARIALVQGVGFRRIEAAVPVLAPWLKSEDTTLAGAAAHALGQIGGGQALRALESAPDAWTAAIVDARLAVASTATPRVAGRIYDVIYGNPGAPDPQRAAALRGMITVRPNSAVKYVQQTLSGNVPAFQQAALEAIATLRSDDVVRQLSQHLPRWAPDVQLAVISALGRRGEATAVPVLTSLITSEDVAARHAAIEALGRLPGNTATAQLLARLASEEGDDAKIAAAALARLHGAGIDEFVLAGATKGEARLRPVFIRQLAKRGQVEAVPALLALRPEAETSLRLAALESLGEIAPPTEQAALLAWALQAQDAAEQNRAVRALIEVLLRDEAKDTRADAVLAAMKSGDTKAKQALLPVLPRVGGAAALATLQAIATGPEAGLAAAAVTNLGRWTGPDAVGALVQAAEKSPDAAVRRSAVSSAIRALEKERDVPTIDETDLLGRLLAVADAKETKVELLWLLSRMADAKAQAIVDRAVDDAEVADVARMVADAVRSNRKWPPDITASGSSGQTANIADGKDSTNWAVPARADAWLQVDLKHARPLRKLILDPARGGEAPVSLEVFVSDDPAAWGEPRLKHEGENGRNVLTLPEGTRGRYVRLVHTGSRTEGNWSVAELTVE